MRLIHPGVRFEGDVEVSSRLVYTHSGACLDIGFANHFDGRHNHVDSVHEKNASQLLAR
jgi:hypothetical protein